MSRRGVALLAVLWVITVITILSALAMAVTGIGSLTTRNRVLLARAAWAREACAEILSARYGQGLVGVGRGLAAVDLGRGTWCDAALTEPATKLNVNLADRAALLIVLRAVVGGEDPDSLADAILAWRARKAFGDVQELDEVPGFTDSLVARVSPFLTTRGGGFIDINAAPREVLATLPGMTEEALELILRRRETSSLISGGTLMDWLSPPARAVLLARSAEFSATAVFAPPEYVVFARGGVRGTAIRAQVTVTLVPVGGRLAVIRRESE